jgi:uncharacterized protein with PQ loop repeat
MAHLLVELLGFVAGMIIAVSALPRVRNIYRQPLLARGEPIDRNAMLTVGNVIWVVYGILTGAAAIATMCGIAAVLNGFVLKSALLARYREKTDS